MRGKRVVRSERSPKSEGKVRVKVRVNAMTLTRTNALYIGL